MIGCERKGGLAVTAYSRVQEEFGDLQKVPSQSVYCQRTNHTRNLQYKGRQNRKELHYKTCRICGRYADLYDVLVCQLRKKNIRKDQHIHLRDPPRLEIGPIHLLALRTTQY